MFPCISQVSTLAASFADDLANAAGAGFPAIELWLTKLEQHLASASIDETARRIADSGLAVAAASHQGGLLAETGERRAAHLEHFKRRLELCQRFAIPTMVIAEFPQTLDRHVLGGSLKQLAEAARWAAGFGVKLALEFRGNDSFCNNLDTAIAIVEQIGEPNLGICLDVFQYYKGPSKPEDLERLTASNLAHVQVCDVAGVPREQMADSDRVMPGDGDFRLEPIVGRLRAIGYAGAVSLELMNPTLWQIDAAQVLAAGKQALDRLLADR